MSSGTVPVVNDIPPFRAAIEPGETGFIADFCDVHQAADTLLEALALDQDRLRQIGDLARRSVAKYSWENVAAELEQLYRRVVRENA
jgi:glycosyltransferase involved in cell wall biosynthesis